MNALRDFWLDHAKALTVGVWLLVCAAFALSGHLETALFYFFGGFVAAAVISLFRSRLVGRLFANRVWIAWRDFWLGDVAHAGAWIAGVWLLVCAAFALSGHLETALAFFFAGLSTAAMIFLFSSRLVGRLLSWLLGWLLGGLFLALVGALFLLPMAWLAVSLLQDPRALFAAMIFFVLARCCQPCRCRH